MVLIFYLPPLNLLPGIRFMPTFTRTTGLVTGGCNVNLVFSRRTGQLFHSLVTFGYIVRVVSSVRRTTFATTPLFDIAVAYLYFANI